jgi:nicotinamidase/pyrazinamidase
MKGDNAMTRKTTHAGLLIVDVQNDFCAGGALAVPGSEQVVSTLSRYIEEAVANDVRIYASRDWHPAVTRHFKTHGGEWPAHCVQGTDGARFRAALHLSSDTVVITKGEHPDSPGYSAFEGHTPEGQSFLADLRERGIEHLYIAGLATDYCVKHSVLDALSAGLKVTVLGDAIAGVDATPGDSARAMVEIREKGAHVVAGAGSLTNAATSLAPERFVGLRPPS